MAHRFGAIDLGASSGRVMVGEFDDDRVGLTEVHRFANEPVETPDGLQWDILRLWREITHGLRLAGPLDSIGIDSWAVDFGLLDHDGRLLANPAHYRGGRGDSAVADVHQVIEPADFYTRTGLQFLSFNTVYQLASLRGSAQLTSAATMLLIPDLLGYWLTGELGCELTNASTTQLLDVRTRQWAWDLIDRLGLARGLFAPLREPGSVLGHTRAELGLAKSAAVITVASHDTASAVLAVPATDEDFCYISSGTWSLVGLELDTPQLHEASRAANFSNEGGVGGSVRYLTNVMGLWLLQQSLSAWQAAGSNVDLDALLAEAATLPTESVFDCDAEVFLPPGDMPARIADECAAAGVPKPQTPAQFVRAILDSLATGYRRAIGQACQLTGRTVQVIHIVGGGSQNALLCQLTADACDLDVVAGPVEASALGNVAVQAQAAGLITGGRAEIRALVRKHADLVRYVPRRR